MTHSYRIHYFHLIWSTKQRIKWINDHLKSQLYPYIAGIIKKQGGHLLEIGGMPDHVHLLVELSNLDKFSYFIRDVKANSSIWVHKNFPGFSEFAWQEGYGSFSVSYLSLNQARTYIQNQIEHHATMSFEEEFLKFLKGHKVQYDERFVLG